MATSWPHGGGQVPRPPISRHISGNRPPVCFNCGKEGHFVVACPESTQANAADFPVHSPQYQQQTGPPPAPQYSPQVRPPQQQYSPQPPAQQYGPPAQYSYSQPPAPQPYNAQPSPVQYGLPGYSPPYSQVPPPNGPPQYSGHGYQNGPQQYGPQQYGPQANGPYQPPTASYQPPYGEYHGSSQGHGHPQYAPQWNNPPPPPKHHSSHSQQRNRSNHGHRGEFPATSNNHVQHHPVPQRYYESESYQQNSLSQNSPQENQYPRPASQASLNLPPPPPSNTSHVTDTPYPGRRESVGSPSQIHNKRGTGTVHWIGVSSPIQSDVAAKPCPENEADANTLSEEKQFSWDLEHIFIDPPKPETVALAQPLATTFDMTPVPRVDVRSKHSISRYARSENLAEFVRSIKSTPQWSYLQEDPVFSDAKLEGPSISLSEVPAWMAKRHGIPEVEEISAPVNLSRKRSWSNDEQLALDNQSGMGEGETEPDPNVHVSKRRKDENAKEDVAHMTEAEETDDGPATPRAGTPVMGRSGTPCLSNVDDAWAPSPGERASSPGDPTETLLASLGVTGEAKPIKKELLQRHESEEKPESPVIGIPQPQPVSRPAAVQTPARTQGVNGTPVKHHPTQDPHKAVSQYEPVSHPNYNNRPPESSPPTNQQHYGPSPNVSWNHGHPAQYHSPPQEPGYGPPANPPYNYGPPAPQYNPSQYGPPNGGSWSSGPPAQNTQYVHPQYADFSPPPNTQYYTQYGPPAPWNPPQNGVYGPSQYTNAPPPIQYAPTQYGPPQYGNPQLSHHGPPQYGPEPPTLQQYGGPQHNTPQYTNTAPNQTPHGPPRQDSGYGSTHSSYGNGEGLNSHSKTTQIRNPQQEGQQQSHEVMAPTNEGVAKPSLAESMDTRSSNDYASSSREETPLSPTSAEILGKLVKVEADEKKTDILRHAEESSKKAKRPAPVVAAAYSRRW